MKNWYNIVVKEEQEFAEVFIFDEIGFWGTTAMQFIRDFKAIEKNKIHLHINSPGGEVMDGTAIYNIIRNSEKTINVFIDGLAASMASVIAIAGDDVTMADNAFFMIHNPAGLVWGEVEEMEKEIEILDKIKSQLITAYENKTGLDREKISKMMDDETWLDAKEAKDLGFVDKITTGQKIAAYFDIDKIGFKNGDKYNLKKNLEKDQNFHANKKSNVKIFTTNLNSNSASVPENNNSEEIMDLNELKAKYPDIYNAAIEDGKKQGIEEGKAEGAKTEAARINAINDLKITGHDDIVNAALADPKMTAADVALAVRQAENKANELNLQNRVDESKNEIDPIDAGAAPDQVDQEMSREKINAQAKAMADIINKQYENK